MTQFSAIPAVKGMPAIYGRDMVHWQRLEQIFRAVCTRYATHEIRLAILEYEQLFKRSVGDTSDIVNKEMYTFEDRRGDRLALRPEGTAGCVRAAIQGRLTDHCARLFYLGPMFRYERPQKGRSRQFHHMGCEWLNHSSILMDIELIAMSHDVLQALGLTDYCQLTINTLATLETRQVYANQLRDYFTPHRDLLDDINQERLQQNPLRILDSKQPSIQDLISKAPTLHEALTDDEKTQFEKQCEALSLYHIDYRIDPHLVRGLDYYNGLVFEWVTDALGSQGTVGAGGRYDTLVEQLGGQHTPALGYAFGMERLVELMRLAESAQNDQQSAVPAESCDVIVMLLNEQALSYTVELVMAIRQRCPSLKLYFDPQAASFKKHFKTAERCQAIIALIIGDDECTNQQVTWRRLNDATRAQETLTRTKLWQCFEQEGYHVIT